ncbi:MAG: histidinol dehydrogenase [Bacteroidia bacterium]
MQVIINPDKKSWKEILKRPVIDTTSLETTVRGILNNVKQYGDKALIKYTEQFDKVKLTSLKVSAEEIEMACNGLDEALKLSIEKAKRNIEKFHLPQIQKAEIIETTQGVKCWRKSVGIEKVGFYIPGGSAPLFSTILMLAVPAKIAECKEIILCTPPQKDGSIHPAILFTAHLVGITQIYKVGGVQAIAAMTYGTETIPQVYKIFGPGNQYVTCAKQLVSNEGVAIDMPAGPSEVAILADNSCVPQFVAADLLSQAEHGPDSQVLLVALNEEIVTSVKEEVEKQLALLPRKEIAQKALENSKAIVISDYNVAMELLNEYAPEHLIMACEHTDVLLDKVVNAGSVFVGNYAPESLGDYASGTNHTLPTNGYARMYSGVSVDSFVKKITFQQVDAKGIKLLGNVVEIMAEAEGLHAHKNAVSVRLDYIKNNRLNIEE